MPRKSLQALTVFPQVDGKPCRIKPPAGLGAAESRLFSEIVASLDAKHFAPSDAHLLGRHCEMMVLAETAAKEMQRNGAVDEHGKLSPWLAVAEKANRAVAAFASKLRLAPSARIGPRDAHRRAAISTLKKPWMPD